MKELKIQEICQAVSGRLLEGGSENAVVKGVSTDSRTAGAGQIFVALKGENHDAHKFIPMALEGGCRAFLISREEAVPEDRKGASFIVVSDTLKGLQDLARYYLTTFKDLKKLAVTGSTGKTTTKDMLYYICSTKYKTLRTKGNFNNEVGLPLTVFSLEEDTQAAIFEMGMSDLGEISLLCSIVKPQVGIITNIGVSHIENLGSRQGILKAKMEIAEGFGPENTLVVNQANDLLTPENTSGNYRRIGCGYDDGCDYVISQVEDRGDQGLDFTITHGDESQSISLSIPGGHNAINSCLALAAAETLGISLAEGARGLESMELTEKRLNVKEAGGIRVIDDTYNASPDSMKAGIDVLTASKAERKIAILADMLEMGPDSPVYHREVGAYAAEAGLDLVVALGDAAAYIAEGAREVLGKEKVQYYKTKDELKEKLSGMLKPGDLVLVKGSRGMAMELIVKEILQNV